MPYLHAFWNYNDSNILIQIHSGPTEVPKQVQLETIATKHLTRLYTCRYLILRHQLSYAYYTKVYEDVVEPKPLASIVEFATTPTRVLTSLSNFITLLNTYFTYFYFTNLTNNSQIFNQTIFLSILLTCYDFY